MVIFDKSLYLQRLVYALEHKSLGHKLKSLDEGELWNYRQQLREAERCLDESIDFLHAALQHRGLFPVFEEAKE